MHMASSIPFPRYVQAVRLSIYTALGSATRRDLRLKTLDMALGGRNGVRLQDIMYPVQAAGEVWQRISLLESRIEWDRSNKNVIGI